MASRGKKTLGRGERIEMKFLEKLRGRCPENGRILEALGELYTRAGRYEEGLKVDLELSKINPRESVVWYNLGCSYALVERFDDAFRALNKAIDLGYHDVEWMQRDSDLDVLRDDPRFAALVKRVGL